MKKWGLFFAMLTIAAAFAFADEVAASQVDDLFADIDAVALSQGEMEAVDGEGGAWAVFGIAMAADWVVEKATGKSPVREIAKAVAGAVEKTHEELKKNNNDPFASRKAPGSWRGAYW